jgi:hypothetical protein
MLGLNLPGFVYTALAALLGIIVWFAIMPRLKR